MKGDVKRQYTLGAHVSPCLSLFSSGSKIQQPFWSLLCALLALAPAFRGWGQDSEVSGSRMVLHKEDFLAVICILSDIHNSPMHGHVTIPAAERSLLGVTPLISVTC